jgi:hypothetical protein
MKYYFKVQLGADGEYNGIITTSLDKVKRILEFWWVEKNFNLPYSVCIIMDSDLYYSNTRKFTDFKFDVEMECQPYATVDLSINYDIQQEFSDDKEMFKVI